MNPAAPQNPEGAAPPPPAEQLAELAALTGGLAHELRNPLSTLRVNLQLLEEDWRQLETSTQAGNAVRDAARRSRARVAALLQEADRLERILADFLQYVGKRDLRPAPCDLNALACDLADFYRPEAAAHGVELQLEPAAAPLLCDVDVHLLKQALLNLLINAQQAMTGGGRITLRLACEGPHARIDVIDTGPGVPAELRELIFRPYFTTKKAGTGLGLATARQIVSDHGGNIRVFPSAPRGSCFSILLPLTGVRS